MALPKKFRLSEKSEIDQVFKKGKSINSKLFNIKFLYVGSKLSRFAIVAGLKISRKAVLRNKIKRSLAEIIRLNIPKFKAGYNVVVMPRLAVLTADSGSLKEPLVKEILKIN